MGRMICVVLLVLGLSIGNHAQNTACSTVKDVAKYKLSDNDGTCLLLNVGISMTIQKNSKEVLTLSSESSASCSNDSSCTNQSVQIGFDLTSPGCVSCKLVFTFNMNASMQWGLAAINFTGKLNISGTQVYLSASNSVLRFSNAANQTFRCNSLQTVSMNTSDANITMLVTTSNLKVQAFSFKGVDQFDSERVCVADLQGLLIVPVAVGSALAALVFVLLIAYLVSRFVAHRQKKLYNKVS